MATKCINDDATELAKKEVLAIRLKHVGSPTSLFYRDDPVMIVRGEGQYMIDENGNRYLDCINNVAHVGHSHPAITAACIKQLSELCTNSRYLHGSHSALAKRLTSTFPDPLDVCFFTNSGSEANDLALKLAEAYTGGTDVITMEGAYHGHVKSCREVSPYEWHSISEKPDFVHVVPLPDMYRGKYAGSDNPGIKYASEVENEIKILQENGKKLSAFIMESLPCCGGQIIPPAGYMREAFRRYGAAKCTPLNVFETPDYGTVRDVINMDIFNMSNTVYKHIHAAGGVCIADEVQVGFGRTGSHYWAFQSQGSDVIPDIVTVGKPIGNGHPISAVITTSRIADALKKIQPNYFNTFGGNPVSCTIANTVMDLIEQENLMENAASVGKYALEKLTELKDKHEIIGDVRGIGLFIGVEFVKDRKSKEPAYEEARNLYQRMKERFILVIADGKYEHILKMKPPMCFSHDNVDHLVKTMDEVLSDIST